jgi:hypothetical protein
MYVYILEKNMENSKHPIRMYVSCVCLVKVYTLPGGLYFGTLGPISTKKHYMYGGLLCNCARSV